MHLVQGMGDIYFDRGICLAALHHMDPCSSPRISLGNPLQPRPPTHQPFLGNPLQPIPPTHHLFLRSVYLKIDYYINTLNLREKCAFCICLNENQIVNIYIMYTYY